MINCFHRTPWLSSFVNLEEYSIKDYNPQFLLRLKQDVTLTGQAHLHSGYDLLSSKTIEYLIYIILIQKQKSIFYF